MTADRELLQSYCRLLFHHGTADYDAAGGVCTHILELPSAIADHEVAAMIPRQSHGAGTVRIHSIGPGESRTPTRIEYDALYLIAQFLNSATNLRTDEYGGSTVNRARFLFEITETVLEFVESGRVGIKIGPMNVSGAFVANADTLPDMEYVIKKLNDYDLAHLLMMGATTDFTGGPLEHLAGDGMFQHFRPLYNGHLIANVEMTQERGNRLIRAGLADSIAFGRPFIANPDLPERFLAGATLNEISWPTVYASGPEGYIDYPAMQRSFPDEASPTRARRHTEPLLS